MVPLLKETMIMRCSSQEKGVLKKMISISKQNPWMSIIQPKTKFDKCVKLFKN